MIDKRGLTERNICSRFITPALRQTAWDEMLQIREELTFTKGLIIVRGELVAREPIWLPGSKMSGAGSPDAVRTVLQSRVQKSRDR